MKITAHTYIILFLLIGINPLSIYSQEDRVNDIYYIDVVLDTATHTLSGHTTLSWTNPDNRPVDHLLFHLYYNAFKNSNSTFNKENKFPDFLKPNDGNTCRWSYSKIVDIVDMAGNTLTDSLRYISPDDGNPDDQTVIKLNLSSPIQPEQTMTLEFEWQAKIPNIAPRTGYNKEYYFFAQWFPKLGVYETPGMRYNTGGEWNCHQYHANGEYYSSFADYTVSMTVPNEFMIASSGYAVSKKPHDSQMTTWTFNCNNVIDFTWSTSPHFTLQEDKFKDTKILFYTYPYKEHVASRYFDAIKFCMNYLENSLGDYPYLTLSIIDPPIHGMFTGGMEYPTLVTSLSFNFFPTGFRTPETLVIHEFIHQYFMQMVASHEVEEPWLDEGFTTYWEGRILDEYLGNHSSMIDFANYTVGTKEYNRYEYLTSKYNQSAPNTFKSYEFSDGGYGPISYNKTALWLQTLERLLGTDLMDTIWKSYFTKWQFHHPCGQDFINIVNEISSANSLHFPDGMDWFFEQVLYGTGLCDYEIVEASSARIETSSGYLLNEDNCTIAETVDQYKSIVTIRRNEEIVIPQTIQLHFKNGKTITDRIDTIDSVIELIYIQDSPLTHAIIDPDTLIYLDKNLLNNSYSIKQETTFTPTKITALSKSIFQNILEFIAILI